MIWQYFRLTATPFPVIPVAGQACLLPSWQEYLEQLQGALEQQQGPAVILGSAGTGKTMLLAVLAQRLAARYRVCHLRDGGLENRVDFWKTLLFELGLPVPAADANDCRRTLLAALRQQSEFAADLLLLIDEAHTLSGEVLEQLRLLSNIVDNGHSRVQFVLAGNHPLEEQLLTPQLNSLQQRIHCRIYLAGMGLDELFSYIDFHWRRVGGDRHPFTDDAIRALHTATNGIPRLVHQLADQTLGVAAQQHLTEIDEATVQVAWSRWQHLPLPAVARSTPALAAAVTRSQASANTTSGSSSVVEFGSLDDEMPTRAAPQASANHHATAGQPSGTPAGLVDKPSAELTQEPPVATATSCETPLSSPSPIPAASSPQAAAVTVTGDEEPQDNIASLVAARQQAQSQTLIRFAFEADIQKPTPTPAGPVAPPMTAAPAPAPANAARAFNDSSQFRASGDSRSSGATPVVPRSYRQWEAAFDTLEQALDRVQQPADAVEDLLIEADLQAITNPIEILEQSARETQQLLAHAPAEVFQDHLYFESLWLQDTVWTQYIQDPAARLAPLDSADPQAAAADLSTAETGPVDEALISIPLPRIRVDQPASSPNVTSFANPMHAPSSPSTSLAAFDNPIVAAQVASTPRSDSPGSPATMEIRIDAQPGRQVNPPQSHGRWEAVRPLDGPAVSWSNAEAELGLEVRTSAAPFSDDAAIIHRQPEPRVVGGRDAVVHAPQTIEPPAMARRKDLRALLHALRGY